MKDKHWVYRPILDLIGFAEGTDRGDGYNETLAYGAYTGGDVSLVSMTLGEVDRLQTRMLRHPNNHWNSSAVGRYQIVRTTLRNLKRKLGLTDNELYNEDMQDRLARVLLYDRGIDDYCNDDLSENRLLLELAREWASFPKSDGRGYYSGQGGKLPPQKVRDTVREVRRRFHSEIPEIEDPEPPIYEAPEIGLPPEPEDASAPALSFWQIVVNMIKAAFNAFRKGGT